MKILIDKKHGLHYHKEDCKLAQYGYTEIEYESINDNGINIIRDNSVEVDGRYYTPCPLCFRYSNRRQ